MAESNANSIQKRTCSPLWPILVTALILAVCGYFCWRAWQDIHSAKSTEAAQLAEMEKLRHTRDELKNLLALTPCEAQERLRLDSEKPQTAPPPMPRSENSKSNPANKTASSIKNLEDACVFLVSTDGKTHLSTGSGFFVAPGYVLTNKHVIEKGKGRVLVTSQALGHPARAKVVATSQGKNRDYALLAVEIPQNESPLPLPFTSHVKKTDKVGAWGFPDLVGKNDPAYAKLMTGVDINSIPELSYSEGVVSAILPRNPEIIVHTAPISPGNSGGPLVNEQGEVVGINTMITLDQSSYRQASLALSSRDVIDFLAANGIKVTFIE